MEFKIKKILSISLAAAFCLAIFTGPALAGEKTMPRGTFKVAASEEKGYGEKKPVMTVREARAALEEYYKGKDVEVGEIIEKELFFEAEVLDNKGKAADRVIIDKRTGRIRSIY
jgi:hypothetical protein